MPIEREVDVVVAGGYCLTTRGCGWWTGGCLYNTVLARQKIMKDGMSHFGRMRVPLKSPITRFLQQHAQSVNGDINGRQQPALLALPSQGRKEEGESESRSNRQHDLQGHWRWPALALYVASSTRPQQQQGEEVAGQPAAQPVAIAVEGRRERPRSRGRTGLGLGIFLPLQKGWIVFESSNERFVLW